MLQLWLLLSLNALACPPESFQDQLDPELVRKRLERAQQPDAPGTLVKRPKQITFNFWEPRVPRAGDPIEAADPTRPVLLPDGRWRVDASGQDGFLYSSQDELLGGGNQDHKRFRIERRWADGHATFGPYHTGNHGWDGLIAQWPVTDAAGKITGYKAVGYLGMMEQPYMLMDAALKGVSATFPQMPLHNYTRSRWAFEISRHGDHEIWTARGPVFGNQPLLPSADERVPMDRRGQWVSENHHHGYGGRPLMDNQGKVFQHDGSYWMIFEQVMEQKAVDHGGGAIGYMPWVTEVVARRMKTPYHGYDKGEKLPDGRPADETVVLCSVRDADGRFNPASDRHGMGYLIEGFNLMGEPVAINGTKYWIGFASPNNYTESYGVTLWFRKFEDGPIGPYQPLVDALGAWKDITAELRAKYGLKGWFGRGDGFFSQRDLAEMALKLVRREPVPFTMIAHGVNPMSVPSGFPHIGWPTAEQFNYYVRSQWLLFGKFVEKEGKPSVEWIDESAGAIKD